MFKLKNISTNGSLVTMLILINCSEDRAYSLTIDIGGKKYYVVETTLPDEDLSYAGNVISTLRKYKGKELPTQLTVAWY